MAEQVRASKDFKILIANIKLGYLKSGKKVPSSKEITQMITKKIKAEDILYDKLIRI